MKLTLIKIIPVAGDVFSFMFQPDTPVSRQAGQYFHYVLPHESADDRGTERWFTNSAAPSEDHIMISTRIAGDEGSSFKHALRALQPGDTIEVDGPEGDFVIDDPTRNYVFVAGGIGITPFRSILVEAGLQGQKLNVNLLYANRDNNIPFKDELDTLAAANPSLRIDYIVQPDRIDQTRLDQAIKPLDNPIVYVSGPEPMVNSFAEQLLELGLSKENIKKDDFPGYEAD